MRCRGLALAAAAVMTLVLAPVALGDGDPASDVLVSQAAFVPSDTGATNRQNAQLLSVLRAAQRAGFPVRVAIIPDSYDLGSVTALWGRPRDYARFLGIELADTYRQRLLVVMPNGIGFDWQGHPSGKANGQLATISATSSSGGLLGAAETAVRSLEASAGVRLVPEAQPSARSSARSGGGSAVVTVIAIAAVLLLMAAGAVALRRRSGSRRRSAPAAAPPAAGQIRPRWLVPGFAVLVCLATGLPIVAVVLLRHRGATPAIAATRVPTPYRWAPGQRRAPDFRLIDQDGRPIRLAAFRGRPVILTFVDPLCRNLCPLAAHVLNDVDATMPAGERPAIIAVSVDIYADKRTDLLEDFHKWDLVPQWHWAVGSPGKLAAVWKHYEIGVSVATKRIAGTTVHYITHDEVAYVIDSSGYVRALFGWPYEPQDVTTVLRQVSRA
jgi:cytochrome oxidase Cu insertion factor (SCO1/SenC/PrrC family)